MSEARKYIDDEFEEMRKLGIHGTLSLGQIATFKMCFLAGMAAALNFSGDDEELAGAIKPALQAISDQYGGRTIFPITD